MPKRVVIIGGGISGLATAHRLWELSQAGRSSLELTLLEAEGRFGGVIETEKREGFLLEGGPDSFLSEEPAVTELCQRLGLESDLIGTQEAFRRSFLYEKESLLPLPPSFYLVAPLKLSGLLQTRFLSWRGKWRVGCEPLIPRRRDRGDESVACFLRRRFGQEVVERIGQPMIGGIYTADLESLSLQATFPELAEMERRFGSVIRGLRSNGRPGASSFRTASGPRYSLLLSFRGGMARFVQGLVSSMRGVDLRSSARVVRIQPGNLWSVELEDGTLLEAEAVCLALPSIRAAALIRSFSEELARDLERIRYESVATVNLAFRRRDVPHPLDGFGFVVAPREERKLVGCTFSSVKYGGRAPAGEVLLRVFLGGSFHREVFQLGDPALERLALDEVQHILGIKSSPLLVSLRRYPESMPQYRVGHPALVSLIEKKVRRYPGLYLTGNAFRGIGIPDCIREGENRAREIHRDLGK